ncbi:hypothetical protein [Sorangium sp. So ce1024]|uniref:hypothetical protein n=1 Tax=Sorangium sp. So ce1024 TaxID=3133327 RepID=UPI003F07A1CA
MVNSNRLLGAMGWAAVTLGLVGRADQDAAGDRLYFERSTFMLSNGETGLFRVVSR